MVEQILIDGIIAFAIALLSYNVGINRAKRDDIKADTILKFSSEVTRLRLEISEVEEKMEKMNGVLWAYVYTLVINYTERGITIPEPPEELTVNPWLRAMMKRNLQRSEYKEGGTA